MINLINENRILIKAEVKESEIILRNIPSKISETKFGYNSIYIGEIHNTVEECSIKINDMVYCEPCDLFSPFKLIAIIDGKAYLVNLSSTNKGTHHCIILNNGKCYSMALNKEEYRKNGFFRFISSRIQKKIGLK